MMSLNLYLANKVKVLDIRKITVATAESFQKELNMVHMSRALQKPCDSAIVVVKFSHFLHKQQIELRQLGLRATNIFAIKGEEYLLDLVYSGGGCLLRSKWNHCSINLLGGQQDIPPDMFHGKGKHIENVGNKAAFFLRHYS